MTPSEARLARLVAARTGRMQPQMARAWLKALDILRRTLDANDIVRLIESGQVDAILTDAQIDRALVPVRDELRAQTEQGFRQGAAAMPTVYGTPAVAFDVLSPRVRQALAELDAMLLAPARAEVRETVRQAVLAGVEQGRNPRDIARGLRASVGLAPHQERAVRNFERALREGDTAKALGYQLRDRRFDRTVRKGALSEAQITKMVAAYRKKFEAHHAETIARTATLNAYRTGQHEAYASAIERGIIDPARAMKTWVNVGDDRVRDDHLDKSTGTPTSVGGETVPFESTFSNGLQYPSEYNCRCFVRYTQKPPVR